MTSTAESAGKPGLRSKKKRVPSGFSPGQNFLAAAALMTATGGRPSRSAALKLLPASSGMRSALKYSGVTYWCHTACGVPLAAAPGGRIP